MKGMKAAVVRSDSAGKRGGADLVAKAGTHFGGKTDGFGGVVGGAGRRRWGLKKIERL